ncbi:hypothetical protein AGMMS49992_33310 [Clostridia bacterium]|nr:hypothetical protein AGMMS49992_33310 [Clostridia bacterium]
MTSATLTIRIDPDIKAKAQALFSSLGLDISTAVNMFIRQALCDQAVSFNLRASDYNKSTLDAMAEARSIASGTIAAKTYNSARELFAELEREEAD